MPLNVDASVACEPPVFDPWALSLVSDPAFVCDAQGHLLWLNGAFERALPHGPRSGEPILPALAEFCWPLLLASLSLLPSGHESSFPSHMEPSSFRGAFLLSDHPLPLPKIFHPRLCLFGEARLPACLFLASPLSESAARRFSELGALFGTLAASREMSFEQLCQSVCQLAVESAGYRLAWVGVCEPDGSVRPISVAGEPASYVAEAHVEWIDSPRGRGPTGSACRLGQVQTNQDFAHNVLMTPWRDRALGAGFQSSCALPLKWGPSSPRSASGALTLYSEAPYGFGPDEVASLLALSSALSAALDHLLLRQDRERALLKLTNSFEQAIRAFGFALEARDPYTSGHQRRVAELSEALARKLGLDEDTIHGIKLGALLHDIGKIAIPAEILSLPRAFTPIERQLVQAHPRAGFEILRRIDFPWPIAEMALRHHERLDGSGYPDGLRGDQIPLGARIIAVADTFESICNHRPYRPALGLERARQEIAQGSGSLFDPAVVQAALALIAEGFRFEGSTPPSSL